MNISTEYLDALVVRFIAGGSDEFTAIWRAVDRGGVRVESLEVDKALQRLRKRGEIAFTGKPHRWRIVGKE